MKPLTWELYDEFVEWWWSRRKKRRRFTLKDIEMWRIINNK